MKTYIKGVAYFKRINCLWLCPLTCAILFFAVVAFSVLATVSSSFGGCSEDPTLESIRVDNLIVSHVAGLAPAAAQVVDIYKPLRSHVRQALGIDLRQVNVQIAVLDDCHFQQLVGNRNIIGFAYPPENLIVIDYSAHNADIIKLRATIKHELSHLFLHGLSPRGMPKWLDEGIAQWVSGGYSEIRQPGDEWTVAMASLSGRVIPLRELDSSFPSNDVQLKLAYAESLSAVDFLIDSHGRDALRDFISHVATGLDASEAFVRSTGSSIKEFEIRWETQTLKHASLYAFIKTHLYEVLFMLASVALVLGFLRTYYRIRTYRDDEGDDPPGGNPPGDDPIATDDDSP